MVVDARKIVTRRESVFIMLKGKVAVVTGGTRGIGYAIVKKYLENGAKVVLFGSRDETVNKALASLKAENPEWEVSEYAPNLLDDKALVETIGKGNRLSDSHSYSL